MPPPLHIEARAVCAGYGGLDVLHEVSLSVAPGEWVGLLGPNGAGKTTLLRVLSGAVRPWRGSVRLGGADLSGMKPRGLAQRLAFVPQALNVPVAFTVRDFVALGRRPHGAAWRPLTARDHAAVRAAIREADLEGMEERLVDELSAGERQRALIALALAQEPDILLLDEPTAHLDIQHAWGVLDLVRTLNRGRGMTVLFSSHDLNLAAAFGGRMALLDAGRVAADGPPGDVLAPALLSRVYRHPLDARRLEDGRTIIWPAGPVTGAGAPTPPGSSG